MLPRGPAVVLMLAAGAVLLAVLPLVVSPYYVELGTYALISAMLYLIIDIEYPRRGLVRIDDFDQMLVDLRRSMD